MSVMQLADAPEMWRTWRRIGSENPNCIHSSCVKKFIHMLEKNLVKARLWEDIWGDISLGQRLGTKQFYFSPYFISSFLFTCFSLFLIIPSLCFLSFLFSSCPSTFSFKDRFWWSSTKQSRRSLCQYFRIIGRVLHILLEIYSNHWRQVHSF